MKKYVLCIDDSLMDNNNIDIELYGVYRVVRELKKDGESHRWDGYHLSGLKNIFHNYRKERFIEVKDNMNKNKLLMLLRRFA